MSFKDWLESMTSTSCIASFARPIGAIVRRKKQPKILMGETMKTWKQFVEAKEKHEDEDLEAKEERLHKDLDGDKEEGESKEHKEKVFFGKKFPKKKDCGKC